MTSGRDEMLSRGHIDYEAEKDRREWWLNSTGGTTQDNLTVRDYFAAKAMSSIIEKLHEGMMCEPDVAHNTADEAYQFADAMMKERAK